MNHIKTLKIANIIKKSRPLRSLGLLAALLLVLLLALSALNISYYQKISANQAEAAKNRATFQSLQSLVLNPQEANSGKLFQKKSFANYDEVVPFIAFLENLFFVIDPKAEITIKSKETQIFMDHFADYQINLKVKDKDILLQALDEIHNSRFITNLISMNFDYKPAEDGLNHLNQVELIVRLFLK